MSTVMSLPFAKPIALGISGQNFEAFKSMHAALEGGTRNRVRTALDVQEEIFDEARMPEDLRIDFRRAVGVSEWGNILGARQLVNSNPLLSTRIASSVLNVAHASEKSSVSIREIAKNVLRQIYGSAIDDEADSLRDRVELSKSREEIHPVDLIFEKLEASYGSGQSISSDFRSSKGAFPNLVAFLRTQVNVAPGGMEQHTLEEMLTVLDGIKKDDELRELFQAIDRTLGESSNGFEKHIVIVMRQIADLILSSGNKKDGLRLLKEEQPLVLDSLIQSRELAAKTKDLEGKALRDFYDATLRRVEDSTRKTSREIVGGFSVEIDNVSDGIEAEKSLLAKYNIDPAKVFIVNASSHLKLEDINEIERDKELCLVKLLKAHEHSLKNRKLGTSYFSNRQYSTSMQLELSHNDKKEVFWTLAGNFEINISELICGERGNMTVALNRAIESLDKELVDGLPESANIGDMLNVKRLAMSSSKDLGQDKSAWQPCSDCYGWMGEVRFFTPDTQILSFSSDEKNNLTVEVRTLRDLLPMQNKYLASMTEGMIQNLPVEYSEEALRVIEDIKLSENVVRRLLMAAKKEYDQGGKINEGFSGKEEAAVVLFNESRRIFSAKRVEWVPRWPEPASLVAAAKGINELSKSGIKHPTVKAVAHYGDHEDIPSIKTNGRLAQKRGSKDVVHIVIENNVIKVRTIKDYQPWVHGSVRQLSTNRETV